MADADERELEHQIEIVRGLTWDLDMSNPDQISTEEITAFRQSMRDVLGSQQEGLEFLLENHPEALKRYRAWANTLRIREPGEPNLANANAYANRVFYALSGFHEGLVYCFYATSRGHTKAESLELIALYFLWAGPRGMDAMARAAKAQGDLNYPKMDLPVVWPEGWAADPDAFRSGADFNAPGVSDQDTQKIVAWYERYLGEVPKHIQFLARHRPEVLKAYRQRYENTLRLLPKECDPYLQIQLGVTRGQASVARNGVLLARGFGMKKKHVLEALTWGAFYGGTPALDYAYDAAMDLLESWPNG